MKHTDLLLLISILVLIFAVLFVNLTCEHVDTKNHKNTNKKINFNALIKSPTFLLTDSNGNMSTYQPEIDTLDTKLTVSGDISTSSNISGTNIKSTSINNSGDITSNSITSNGYIKTTGDISARFIVSSDVTTDTLYTKNVSGPTSIQMPLNGALCFGSYNPANTVNCITKGDLEFIRKLKTGFRLDLGTHPLGWYESGGFGYPSYGKGSNEDGVIKFKIV